MKHFSWNDYYDESITAEETISNKEFSSINITLNPNQGNTHIYNCNFHDMTALDGGAIFYSLSNSNLLVEKCFFLNCNATRYTTAIRVEAGNSIFAFLCGQYGHAGEYDSFSTVTNGKERTINSIFDSSVSHCFTEGSQTMYHEYGYVYVKSLNISHNKAKELSSFYAAPNKNETIYGSFISYSSFSNNTSESFCLRTNNQFSSEPCIHKIKHSNIIENKGYITIYSRGITHIIDSCIHDNGNSLFYTETRDSQIVLINCSSDIDSSEAYNVTKIGSVPSFIHGLTFISTGSCYASFDVIDSLIPTAPTKNSICKCQCTERQLNYFPLSYHTLNCIFYLICIYSF